MPASTLPRDISNHAIYAGLCKYLSSHSERTPEVGPLKEQEVQENHIAAAELTWWYAFFTVCFRMRFWRALCHYDLLLLHASKFISSNTLCSQLYHLWSWFGSRCIPDKLGPYDHIACVGKKVYWIQNFRHSWFLVLLQKTFFIGHLSFFFKKQAISLEKQMTYFWG